MKTAIRHFPAVCQHFPDRQLTALLTLLVFFLAGVRVTASPGDIDAAYSTKTTASQSVRTLALQADGKLLVGGLFTTLNSVTMGRLGRLEANGDLDASFPNPNINQLNAIAVHSDDAFYIGGNFSQVYGASRPNLARILTAGALDAGFLPAVPDNEVFALAPLANGQLYVGGRFSMLGAASFRGLTRVNDTGGFTGFADNDTGNTTITGILPRPDSSVVVSGILSRVRTNATTTLPRNNIARFSSAGIPDASFAPATVNNRAFSLLATADNRILVGGVLSSGAGFLARLLDDGTTDPAFTPAVIDGGIDAMALQADGAILIGGRFRNVGGQPRDRFARLLPDGALDTSFPNLGLNGNIAAIALQDDGAIILGGGFGSASVAPGLTLANIARFANSPATSSLSATSRSRVRWLRGGTAPEASAVGFELSTDAGLTWQTLGQGTRINGGWALNGLSLPSTGRIRARAQVGYSGETNGLGLVEEITDFTVHKVTFDLGPHVIRLGGAPLVQFVNQGGNAVAPSVIGFLVGDFGHRFVGWDVPFTNVQGDLTVRAIAHRVEAGAGGAGTSAEDLTGKTLEITNTDTQRLLRIAFGSTGGPIDFAATETSAADRLLDPTLLSTWTLSTTLPPGAPLTLSFQVGAVPPSTILRVGYRPAPGAALIVIEGAALTYDGEFATVSLGAANIAPTLDPIPAQIGREKRSLTFTAVARDGNVPADSLTFTLEGAPSGAAIHPDTGVFTWIPTNSQGPTSYVVTIKVSDGIAEASRTVQIQIDGILGQSGDDDDGDGSNNGAEFLAQTDPLDHNSRFTLTLTPIAGGYRATLSPTAVGTDYLLETSLNLRDWAPGSLIQPTMNGVETFDFLTTEPNFFVRARIDRP